ncbi:MAG: rhodanese-like domain-containing protein [candidate division Zixibacteria bacterium]|nr:rhodanese-like domain-containing protein [candidate division Zixibacteria bacterium]
MSTAIRQAVPLVILALILAVVSNVVLPNRIPYIGNWPSLAGSDSVIVPPSAQEGDPPFISLDEAAALSQSSRVIFVDSRYPEDYVYGRIAGSINLPFELIEDFWDRVTLNMPKDREYVVYCSGDECETSLLLGREMVYQGYEKVYVFFGGWREWERAGLPVERGE